MRKKDNQCGRCLGEFIDVGDGYVICPHCDTACNTPGCESCVRSSKGSVPKMRR